MFEALPAWPLLLAFSLASLVLAATPGPGVLYIVTRTLAQGRLAGLASVAGVAAGNFGNALGASLGVAAFFALSPLAFTLLRFAGGAYLVWLGWKALRASRGVAPPAAFQAPGLGSMVRDGFWVALLNPKTAIFFAAFLPQFMHPQGSVMVQSVLFGAAFVLIAAATDSAYVWTADLVGPALRGRVGAAALGRYASAAVYIVLGAYAAFSGALGMA
jgi:threonine/homoserine/homoserine lactone efflux protein